MVNVTQLTKYELELMDVIWELGEATVQQVCDHISRPLAYTTVMTTLNLLEKKKKVLERKKQGRAYLYRPTVTREDVSRGFLRELKDVLFRGRLSALVHNMLSEEDITPDDVAELRSALDDLEAQS
ncbi:MAG: BlaI/MecI/CopY family transcriptional regulator [Planctomycetaceae bacterium]|nr:BlaI/MecI/CopY family transcriptional regulator [Planctomycetaceae bacterium]